MLTCAGLDSNRGVLNIFTNEVHSVKINPVALDRTNKLLRLAQMTLLFTFINSLILFVAQPIPSLNRQAYKKLSFNHNGEYLAASSA